MNLKRIVINVSPFGNDNNSGDEQQPICHIEKAVQMALSGRYEGYDIVIQLLEGKYQISRPIFLDETQTSGLASLTFQGIDSSKTKCSGTVSVFPKWQPYRDGIYVAQIQKGLEMDGLICNGKIQIMARYPNYQENVVLNGFSQDAVSEERASRWSHPEGGYIRALHHAEWGSNSYIITGKTESGKLTYQWVGDNNRGSEMHAVKRMVENIFEELDAPKEWYYNRQTGELFFYPEKASDLLKEFEAIVNPEIFKIVGSSTNCPIGNIAFENIGFENTARTLFTGQYERILRSDWGIVRAGVLCMENAQNITVKNCSFHQIGGNAVTMSGFNKGHVIEHNDFTAIGATGVLAAGLTSAVRDPSEYDNNRNKTTISDFRIGPKTEDYPREILISNNYFYDIGTYEKQTAAICLSVSSDIVVRANTIHHTSRAGININAGAFGGHVIEDNDMFDCVTETADHGPFNSWGRDRYWSVPQHDAMGYYGKEKRAFAELDAYKTTVVRHNRVHASHAFGLDFDDGTSNYDIYNNLCIGVGIKLRDGFDRRVHNNLLIGSGFELHMSFEQNNDLIYSNVVYFNKAYNQLCVSPKATTVFSHNLYWNGGEEIIGLPEQDFGSVIADPCFVDLENNDFRLSDISPALKLGFVNFPMENDDFGRIDKPNPPVFHYTPIKVSDRVYHYHDVVLSDIEGEGIRSAAGLPNYNGAYVVGRDVLGLFCELGLPIGVGDVIVKVGDTEIEDCQQFIDCFEQLPVGVSTEIIIYRSQKPITLNFVTKQVLEKGIAGEATQEWLESYPE